MNQKQSNLINYAESLGVVVDDIENYINKESVIHCRCKNGHLIQGSVDYLLKTSFECLECEREKQKNIVDTTPYFLSLDAATYTTGMSVFNKEGQLLGHKTFNVDKKKDYFTRLELIIEEIYNIITKQDIKCVILEDIQYQQNPVLFKKLAMLQGVIRYWVINVLKIELITAMADEWRSYNHIYGTKRPEQKTAAIARAKQIFDTDIPEDESESIFLGNYGIYLYYQNKNYREE
jgi:hypothetical protein